MKNVFVTAIVVSMSIVFGMWLAHTMPHDWSIGPLTVEHPSWKR